MQKEQLLAEAKRRLLEAFGDRLRGVVLYGSVARGDDGPDSDVDLLVLLDPPVDLGPDLDRIVHALYPMQLELETPIVALPAAADSYERGEFGLFRNAQREGVRA